MFPTPGLEPANTGIGWIRASKDRIGALLYPGMVANSPEWIELDFDGKILGHWQLGPNIVGDSELHRMTLKRDALVFTADGRLLAETTSCSAPGKCSQQLVEFDRATSSWKTIAGSTLRVQPANYGYLFGTDHDELAFEQQKAGLRLSWFRLAKTE